MNFNFKKLTIPDLILIEPAAFKDNRGFFIERYKQSDFDSQNIPHFVQDNYSFSKQGVIRGFHYQLLPHAQGKLVSVVKGKAWDVAIDVRKKSAFFGKWVGVELSEENNLSFYIPPGFAHGFSALSPEVGFFYKCTSEYNPSCERGIVWNDPALGIDWKVTDPLICEKDKKLPLLKDAEVFK